MRSDSDSGDADEPLAVVLSPASHDASGEGVPTRDLTGPPVTRVYADLDDILAGLTASPWST